MNSPQTFGMNIKTQSLTVTALAILAVAFLYLTGFLGSSAMRVARDHSISLPSSVSDIHCEGLFSITTFGDYSAATSFKMDRCDLNALLSQFKWTSDPQFAISQATTYKGTSRDGNVAELQLHQINDSLIGVQVYTLWN